jgi:hypothetical protein
VRETRVVTPNNYTVGAKGTLAAVYDSKNITWDTRTWFELARTVINLDDVGKGTIIQKTADDLEVSTELQLKFIELSMGTKGRVSLIPYTNVTFDTEFTPTTNQLTGAEYPHQKDLYASLGVVTFPGAILQEVRLAGLLRTDFAASQGRVDGGFLLGMKLEIPLWLARLRLGGTLRYFAPTDLDTVDKLGLMLQGSAKLLVPFTRDLSVFLGADLFLFRPKVLQATDLNGAPVERGTAASVILSAGLSFDHCWKLY